MSEPTDRELADELRNWAVAMESAGWPPVQAVMRLAASRLDRSAPREPTEEMIIAGGKFSPEEDGSPVFKSFADIWLAMWDASPTRADNRKE